MQSAKRILTMPFLVLFAIMALVSACNIYAFTQGDDESSDLEVMLGNADSAMQNNDYGKAANLYFKVIEADVSNSRARVGYASAILMRDMEITDVPVLLNSIINADSSASNEGYLTNLQGRAGQSMEEYRSNVKYTVSNASYYRAPVIGIDPMSGYINLGTNGEPVATASDGIIPANDRTVMLNYLITKSVHVAMVIQDRFDVSGDLVAGIDEAAVTNDSSAAWTNKAEFISFHTAFTNELETITSSYVSLTNALLTTNANISPFNVIVVAESLMAAISNAGFDQSTVDQSLQMVTNLRSTLNLLVDSMTNTSRGILADYSNLLQFKVSIESNASNIPAGPPLDGPFMPY